MACRILCIALSSVKLLHSDGVDPKFQHPDGSGPNNYFIGLCSMIMCFEVVCVYVFLHFQQIDVAE